MAAVPGARHHHRLDPPTSEGKRRKDNFSVLYLQHVLDTEGPVVERLRTTAGRERGIGDSTPHLTWSTRNALECKAFRVQLAESPTFADVRHDTGELLVSSVWVAWPGPPLVSRQRVYWRVQVLTESGWTPWAASVVEAGLFKPSDWVARPIGPAEDLGTDGPAPAPILSVGFTLPTEPVSARLYVTALGLVEATVNGAAVSEDLFAPGWSSYDHRLAYDTYDVTALLRPGDNMLAATLGDGWYRGGLLWGDRRHRSHYGDRVALLAQLEVLLSDGSTVVVASDEHWTATTGPVRSADLYDGCVVDLTVEPGPAGPVVVSDVDVLPRLYVREGPPVRRTEILPSLTPGPVHDFGQNLAGWVRLRVQGPGTITVRHAEILVDGELCTAPLRSAKATDSYTVPAGEHVLEPTFTFHGFRYCEVTTDLEVLSVEAVAVHSDLERTGWFACSDPSLMKLHENVVWGQRGNFLSVPTDCPQRDERLGWTGDAQVFSATASRLHDCRGFFTDWLGDLRIDQHESGEVPVVVPDVLSTDEAGIAGWGDAACVVPWAVAARSADPRVLRQALQSMQRWVDWIESQLIDGLWLSDRQLGDWLDPDGPPEHPWASKADRSLVANAVFVRSSRLLAEAFDACGQDGSRYDHLATLTAERAWARWGSEAITTQTGCALVLRCGLVPADEVANVAAALAGLVAANGGRIGTGFLGTPEVLYALSDHGQLGAAYQLLTTRDCPSWLYQVDQGATTMWERWDAILPDGSVHPGQLASSDGGMLSFNHYAYGAVAAWMHDVVAGLVVRELPYPELLIAPQPGGGVTWAESRLLTPRGEAAVRWDLEGGQLRIQATVPPGYIAWLVVPRGWSGPGGPVPAGTGTWLCTR